MKNIIILLVGISIASVSYASNTINRSCYSVVNNNIGARETCDIKLYSDKKGNGYMIKSKKIGNYKSYEWFDSRKNDLSYTVNGKPAEHEYKGGENKYEFERHCYIDTTGKGFCIGLQAQDMP